MIAGHIPETVPVLLPAAIEIRALLAASQDHRPRGHRSRVRRGRLTESVERFTSASGPNPVHGTAVRATDRLATDRRHVHLRWMLTREQRDVRRLRSCVEQ